MTVGLTRKVSVSGGMTAPGDPCRSPADGAWNPAPPPAYAAPLAAVDEYCVERTAAGMNVRSRTLIGRDPQTLRGHFPDVGIYPGVFVLDTLAQAMTAAVGSDPALRVSEVHSLRFLNALMADDELLLDAQAHPEANRTWAVSAQATSQRGTRCATIDAVLHAGPAVPRREPRRESALDSATPDLEILGARAAKVTWGHRAVQALLPQRHPILLIDRVVAFDPDRTLVAEKAVSATEPCYGRSDGDWAEGSDAYPVSLQLESLGQAAALLWLAGAGQVPADAVLMFAGLRGYQVTGQAFPGEVLRHIVELTHSKADTAFACGATWADGRLIAHATTMIAVCRHRSVLDRRHLPPVAAEEAVR